MPKYSIAKYAERVGLSRAYIYKLEREDKIDFTIKGKRKFVDSDQADAVVKYKPAHRATPKTYQENGAKRKSLGPEAASGLGEKPELDKNTGRVELERALLYEKAKKARIDNEQKEGLSYKKSEIEEKSFDLFRQIRDGVLSLQDRVALKCRAAESDHEARQILNDEIHSILNSIIEGYDQKDEAVKKKILSLLT